MNFDLSDEQKLLCDSVDRLFEAHAAATPRDLAAQWRDYVEMGLLALPFPAEIGGYGGGPEAVMLVMEAYGRTLGTAPYLQSVLLAGSVLEGARAHDVLAEMLGGRSVMALCLHEPRSRYRWDLPAMTAEPSPSGWVLTGEKVAVLDADRADTLIFPAMTPDGLGIFLVPANAAGVSLRSRPTPDGRNAADIRLTDVSTAVAIGDPARNREILAAAIDGAIVAVCGEAVGAMERLLAITTEYLGTRQQFGVALGSFQALQHRAADMLVAIEQARSITFYAISMLDGAPEARGRAAAAAKALANRAARFVGSEAIQLLGGMGLASEYPAGRYFQRLTVLESMFGDTDHMLSEVEHGGGLAG